MEGPNGWGILFICSFFIVFMRCIALGNGEGYTPLKIEMPGDMESVRVFTDDDIAKYDGSEPSEPLYMGVKGVVFDVTSGKRFYGPGTSYHALVGKDCTRAVAKMSLQPDDLNSDLSGLSDELLKGLDDIYKGTYLSKYPIAGYMDYLVKEWQQAKSAARDDL